jgi:squalene-hopene/tetraprenyl-beta-curcumene cyclase
MTLTTVRRCIMASVLIFGLGSTPAPLVSQVALRAAAWDRTTAAAYLDSRQAWWRTWPNAARDHGTSCVSCHTTLGYALARPALRDALGEAGPTAAETGLIGDVTTRVTLWTEVEPFYPDQTVGLPKTSESRGTEAILNAVILASRDARDGRLSDDTRHAFENLWNLQFTRGDGTGGWAWLHFGLAPWESDGAEYFGAALAAVAVGVAPEGYASSSEVEDRVRLLRGYLLEDWNDRRLLDQAMLLWASSELPDVLTGGQKQSIIRGIGRQQNEDGGWSLGSLGAWERQDGLTQNSESDGYATGLIAYVLQRAGVAEPDPVVSRGLSWLVQNQDAVSGQWHAQSLNKSRDPESDRGRFMSDAATAFAVLALTEAEAGGADPLKPIPPLWYR